MCFFLPASLFLWTGWVWGDKRQAITEVSKLRKLREKSVRTYPGYALPLSFWGGCMCVGREAGHHMVSKLCKQRATRVVACSLLRWWLQAWWSLPLYSASAGHLPGVQLAGLF